MNKKKILFFSLAAVLAGIFFATISRLPGRKLEHQIMKVYQPSAPSSLDPLDYDYFKHHPIQSIFHIKLVSSYRGSDGTYPQLAQSWQRLNSAAEWRFKIRNDIYFSEKSPVEAEAVIASFKRIIYLLKKQESKNEIVRFIKGVEKLDAANGELSGLRIDKGEIVFEFDRPIPELLEILSFGLFAIADPQSYDPITGAWIEKDFAKVRGAGPYRLDSMNQEAIVFSRKVGYPSDLFHPNSFGKIEFVRNAVRGEQIDIGFGPSDSAFFNDDFQFFGRGARNIMYAHVLPWKNKSNFLSRIENRIALREAFYEQLIGRGVKTTRSFLPLIMPGIHEPKWDGPKGGLAELSAGVAVKFNDVRPSNSKSIQAAMDSFEGAVASLGLRPVSRTDVSLEEIHKSKGSPQSEHALDIAFLGTGISLERPASDVRLMFSKEGVWLADSKGLIKNELAGAAPNFQFINEKLHEEAIIWPFARYDLGVWARNTLDLSDYNTLKPPGELQWIGIK